RSASSRVSNHEARPVASSFETLATQAPQDEGMIPNRSPAVADQADVFYWRGRQFIHGFVMRSWLAATLIFATVGAAAQAQMVAAPATGGAKTERVANVPVRPP